MAKQALSGEKPSYEREEDTVFGNIPKKPQTIFSTMDSPLCLETKINKQEFDECEMVFPQQVKEEVNPIPTCSLASSKLHKKNNKIPTCLFSLTCINSSLICAIE
jgi:hypothetical protein